MNALNQTKEDNDYHMKEAEETINLNHENKKICPPIKAKGYRKSLNTTNDKQADSILGNEFTVNSKPNFHSCSYAGCKKKFKSSIMLRIHETEHPVILQTNSKKEEVKEDEVNLKTAAKVYTQFSKFKLPHFFYSKSLPLPRQLRKDKDVFEELYYAYINYTNREEMQSVQDTGFDATAIN
jgi:hypothetical protein